MMETYVTVKDPTGIGARAACCIVETAMKFASKITFTTETETVDVRSILSIICLGACYNTALLVRAEGPDEAEAVQAFAQLFEQPFDMEG
jgi:phosphotransferase system HPr (HPr) family protein